MYLAHGHLRAREHDDPFSAVLCRQDDGGRPVLCEREVHVARPLAAPVGRHGDDVALDGHVRPWVDDGEGEDGDGYDRRGDVEGYVAAGRGRRSCGEI